MFKDKGGWGATRIRSDNPLRPLNNIFPPLRSSIGFLQSHTAHISPLSERLSKPSASLPSYFPSEAQWSKTGWETAKRRGLKDLHIVRLSCRAMLFIQLIIRWLSQPIKQKTGPISKTFLQGWRVWTADFGGRLVKLGVPWRDVGADGEIVWANASCSPSVPVFSPSPELLSFS